MNGSQRVIIQNKRIRYDFTIYRNITILYGDSATGKTTLIDMVQDYYENGSDSSISLQCAKECVVLSGRNWKAQLSLFHDSLIFIDEGNPFITSEEFARTIAGTDNYYIIATREDLENLPYSVTEIYGIRNTGIYGGLKQTYNDFYRVYGQLSLSNDTKPLQIIVEDSGAGYQFFSALCGEQGLSCTAAQGKSNIFKLLTDQDREHPVLVIADGAAFGSQIAKVYRLLRTGFPVILYLPESFEWILLTADLLKDNEIRQILAHPEEYIDSAKHISWERFFTDLLTAKTAGTIWKYSKKQLNPIYLHQHERAAVIAAMPSQLPSMIKKRIADYKK